MTTPSPAPNVFCAWCQKPLYYEPALPVGEVSHGICEECCAKNFPKEDCP